MTVSFLRLCSRLIQQNVKSDDTEFVEQCLDTTQGVALHPALITAIAAMLASRLYLPLFVAEGIRTPFKIVLDMR